MVSSTLPQDSLNNNPKFSEAWSESGSLGFAEAAFNAGGDNGPSAVESVENELSGAVSDATNDLVAANNATNVSGLASDTEDTEETSTASPGTSSISTSFAGEATVLGYESPVLDATPNSYSNPVADLDVKNAMDKYYVAADKLSATLNPSLGQAVFSELGRGPMQSMGAFADLTDFAAGQIIGLGAGSELGIETQVMGKFVVSETRPVATETLRRAAVAQAWKDERALFAETGSGTRDWTEAEGNELLRTGKVSGYHGHHINSVKQFPQHAGNPNNIRFLTPGEHLAAHSGNWRNPTSGVFLER
jgi:hypothetical protein